MRFFRITMGMMLGMLVGAGVVLLFAPQSGTDLRQTIQDRIQAIVDEGQQAAAARRLELAAQFEALKQPNQPR
jgi:gas vesicle protein